MIASETVPSSTSCPCGMHGLQPNQNDIIVASANIYIANDMLRTSCVEISSSTKQELERGTLFRSSS